MAIAGHPTIRRMFLHLLRWKIILRHWQPSSGNLWNYVSDHPKFAGLLAFVALAVTFSPKASVMATWICLFLAWVLAATMISGTTAIRASRYPAAYTASLTLVIGFLLFPFGKWLTANKEESQVKSMPSITDLYNVTKKGATEALRDFFPKSKVEQTKSETPKPKAEQKLTEIPRPDLPPQLILTFKNSLLLTQVRKDRIAADMERFYLYLVHLGLDAPKEVPAIAVIKGETPVGAFTFPGPVYVNTLSIPEKKIDDPATGRRAYAMYCFPLLLNTFNPNSGGRSTRASWVFERYFLASFSDQSPTGRTSDIDKWVGALWDIRNQIGRAQTDRILSFTLKAFNDFNDFNRKETFSRYFYNSLIAGVHVVDNDGNLIQKIKVILEAKGLPVDDSMIKPPS